MIVLIVIASSATPAHQSGSALATSCCSSSRWWRASATRMGRQLAALALSNRFLPTNQALHLRRASYTHHTATLSLNKHSWKWLAATGSSRMDCELALDVRVPARVHGGTKDHFCPPIRLYRSRTCTACDPSRNYCLQSMHVLVRPYHIIGNYLKFK